MKTTIFAVTFAEINGGEMATNAPILCSSFEMAVVEMLLDIEKQKMEAKQIDPNETYWVQINLQRGTAKMVYDIEPNTNHKVWRIEKMEMDISIIIE